MVFSSWGTYIGHVVASEHYNYICGVGRAYVEDSPGRYFIYVVYKGGPQCVCPD